MKNRARLSIIYALLCSGLVYADNAEADEFTTDKFSDIGLACIDAQKKAPKRDGKQPCLYRRQSINDDALPDTPTRPGTSNFARMTGEIISVIWIAQDGYPRLAVQVTGTAYKQCNGNVLFQEGTSNDQSNSKSECEIDNSLSKAIGMRVFSKVVSESDWNNQIALSPREAYTFESPRVACFIKGGLSDESLISSLCAPLKDIVLEDAQPKTSTGTISHSQGFSFGGKVTSALAYEMNMSYSTSTTVGTPDLVVDQRLNTPSNVAFIYSSIDQKYKGNIANGEYAQFKLPKSVMTAGKLQIGFGLEYSMNYNNTPGDTVFNIIRIAPIDLKPLKP